MKRIVLVIFAACGGTQSAPAPVANTAPAAASPAPTANGTIRVVQRGTPGGVIELQGDRDATMPKAESEMTSVCGASNYVIVQEGEEAIQGSDGTFATAWRVHYRCLR